MSPDLTPIVETAMVGWTGRKVLGPTFDQIGLDIRDRYVGFRGKNASRIGRNAQAKLKRGGDPAGIVPPRVAIQVFDEGSWCDAAVMAEYFGGILAASKSADGSDDRGATWAALIARLSTYDVYVHYLIYGAFRNKYLGETDLNLADGNVRNRCEIYLPASEILEVMGKRPTDDGGTWGKFGLAPLSALIREGLIGERYTFGPPAFFEASKQIDAPDTGAIVCPSLSGIELFMWPHGFSDFEVNALTDPSRELQCVEDLGTLNGAMKVEVMRTLRSERIKTDGASANPE